MWSGDSKMEIYITQDELYTVLHRGVLFPEPGSHLTFEELLISCQ